MCGFVGVISKHSNLPSSEALRSMRDTLVHRGPDDSGEYFDKHIALGFRRLSIVDVSPRGHQPMSDATGALTIVFNGEIYNHVELRAVLRRQGYRFQSEADTEVLLALYEQHGTDMFQYINGMFAFALYDKKKRLVILARDRLGVKPLFYYTFCDGMAFGSELKAVRLLPQFPREINNRALGMYMRLNFVPGSTCIYTGVEKVPPAHYVIVNIDNPEAPTAIRYWGVDWDVEPEHRSERYWVDQIEELLYDAVRIRLRADVPVATFLSGGIDSSLVTAMASKACGRGLQAFTVGMPGEHDEQPKAEATAKHLGITLSTERMEGDALSLLPTLAAHFDEPFADMSFIPTYQICERMKKHATVVLSGDGGDEMFAGYLHHMLAWKVRRLDSLPDWLVGSTMRATAKLAPRASWLRRNLLRQSLPRRFRASFSQRDVCEEWQSIVLKNDFVVTTEELIQSISEYNGIGAGRTALDRAQAGDLELLLPDNMLVKVDRMSMKTSVEVRSPFLDYRFAELVPRIPPWLRVKDGLNKYLLRRLAERYLPPQIAQGPKKGFGPPTSRWLFEDEKQRIQRWLMEDGGAYSITNSGALEWLWDKVKSQTVYSPAIFRLLVWKAWEANVRGG